MSNPTTPVTTATRAPSSPDRAALVVQRVGAITPKDYTAFQLPGMELPDADRLAAYAAVMPLWGDRLA